MRLGRFIRQNWSLLLFGFLSTGFGSFGQTFLIALFMPAWITAFGLDKGSFGILYSSATLFSALTLPSVGRLIDRADLRSYALIVTGALALSCFMAAWAPHLIVLFVAIYGLRLCGQGLMVHIGTTSMARYFHRLRGRALSLALLGAPAGEAVLPWSVTRMIDWVGWRGSWQVLGAVVLVALVPAVLILLRRSPNARESVDSAGRNDDLGVQEAAQTGRNWTRREVMRDPRFYFLLPAAVIPPFFLTGLFLYQVPLADWKGWSVELLASAFLAFAVGRVSLSLLSGFWIDRFGAARLFPYYLIPFGVGLVILLGMDHPAAPFLYLGLSGFTAGMGGNLKSALWAELYGVAHLGALKSFVASLAILSTAVSPALTGLLLESGVQFGILILICAAAVVVATGLAVLGCRTPDV